MRILVHPKEDVLAKGEIRSKETAALGLVIADTKWGRASLHGDLDAESVEVEPSAVLVASIVVHFSSPPP